MSIRRGKQILAYEYEAEVDWMADSEADECNGTFRVQDINAEEMDFEIVSLKLENSNTIGSKARRILKKGCLKDELIKLFKPLREEIMAIEGDKKKLE